MKILILSIYYNRPKLLRKAMESVLTSHQNHSDWEMVFGDDNSPIPGEPIVREILSDFVDRITFINSNMSFDEKIDQGIQIGRYANQVIKKSNADIAITLCDDDELVPTYTRDICKYFENNPEEMWAYSHLAIFNPLYKASKDVDLKQLKECPYNFTSERINPVGKLDSSQIAFRLKAFESGVQYPDNSKSEHDPYMPWLINPDAGLFQSMHKKFGNVPFSGLISQYKGIHEHQLVWHKKQGRIGLKEYTETINQLAGKTL